MHSAAGSNGFTAPWSCEGNGARLVDTRTLQGTDLKLLIWTAIPTHHQSGFFAALRAQKTDLIVHYYSRVDEQRQRLGWANPRLLPHAEHYVAASLDALHACPDWRERIHIIPGYGTVFLFKLAAALSRAGVPWLHWSEPSRTVLKSMLTYPLKRVYAQLVNRRALGALAIGECARLDFIRWGIREDRIRFLPYAIPAPELPALPECIERAPQDRTAIRFAFVGALCKRKGIDVLLLAFRQVLSIFPNAQLELAGYDETLGQYARLAQQLQMSHAAHFTGSIPAAQIASVFSRCDVFVLPSRFDGWGVVLNEAAALGKAIISTEPTGAAHHLIAHGKNGYRVRAADPDALAQAMITYCRNPRLAALHGEQSRLIFRDFTPERNARRLREAIESLLPPQSRVAGSSANEDPPRSAHVLGRVRKPRDLRM